MSDTDNSKPITRDKTATATKAKTPAKRGISNYALVEEVTQADGTTIFNKLPLPEGLKLEVEDDGKTAKILKALVRVSDEGETAYQGKKLHVIYYTGEGYFIQPDPKPRFKIGR